MSDVPAGTAFCRWCGRPAGGCDGVTCRRPLDPPRFCPVCGRRLRVLVIPTGFEAACRDHGPVAGVEPEPLVRRADPPPQG